MTHQQRRLTAMTAAREKWGAFALLIGGQLPPTRYWIDAYATRYKRRKPDKYDRQIRKLDISLFGRPLDPA